MTDSGDETRERLVVEARDLYLRDGPARFSLREAARQAKVSPAAVYRHFKDKDALLQAVTAAGFTGFRTYLMRSLSASTPRARLAASAQAYLRFGLENPLDYQVLFMDRAPSCREPMTTASETFQFIVDRVRECIDAQVIRKGDPVEIATFIWAHVHGLVSLRLCGHLDGVGTDAEFARFYERSTDLLVAGLGPK